MVSVDAPVGGEAGVTAPEIIRALAYPALTGKPVPGDRVLLNTTALHQGLGTGGYALVVAMPDRLPPDPGLPGHVVKARYTPLQATVASVDEQDSPWHSLLRDADSIDGMPVVVADLHSALPAVLAGLRHQSGTGNVPANAAPSPAVAYVMQDGGALPAWFSRTVAGLRSAGWLAGTVTTGQSFGGDLEAVTVHTGLLAARHVLGADMAIVDARAREPGHRDPLGLLRRRGGRGRQRGGRPGRPPGRELAGLVRRSARAAPRGLAPQPHRLRPGRPGAGGRHRAEAARRAGGAGGVRCRGPQRTAPGRGRGRGRPHGGAAQLARSGCPPWAGALTRTCPISCPAPPPAATPLRFSTKRFSTRHLALSHDRVRLTGTWRVNRTRSAITSWGCRRRGYR